MQPLSDYTMKVIANELLNYPDEKEPPVKRVRFMV